MIQINNPEECSGCTACMSICPHKAITMEPDVLGFMYPVVNLGKCVDCGLCETVCSFNPNYETELNFQKPIAIGARHKDITEVMKSRSGALFVAISDFVLNKNGVIYGVGYKDHFIVTHKRAVTQSGRDEFRGSKYVQSDLTGIFKSIKKDLIDGKHVMFVGTACQTAGLNSYIGKRFRNNLLIIDIVCHGTPGPKIWRDYITHLEENFKSKICQINFRDKLKYGWASHRESYKLENGNEISLENSFYRHILFRKSCGKCHFCNLRRPSDITIADFWGWEKQNTNLNRDNRGLNLVLINTNKGWEVFNGIKSVLEYFTANNDSYLQPNLCHPTPNHPYRDVFEEDYKNKGFQYAFNHDYDRPSIKDRVRRLGIKYLKIHI